MHKNIHSLCQDCQHWAQMCPISTLRCFCSLTSCARFTWLALIWQGTNTPVSIRAHSWWSRAQAKLWSTRNVSTPRRRGSVKGTDLGEGCRKDVCSIGAEPRQAQWPLPHRNNRTLVIHWFFFFFTLSNKQPKTENCSKVFWTDGTMNWLGLFFSKRVLGGN